MEFRCSFRVGRKVLLVVRFEQRRKLASLPFWAPWWRRKWPYHRRPEPSGSGLFAWFFWNFTRQNPVPLLGPFAWMWHV